MAGKTVNPITSGYCTEIDTTPELGMRDVAYFHSLIGVLRWIVELGRIYINVEASILSSHLVLPREDNFQGLLHVFTYIKKHMNNDMVFDMSEPDIDMNSFHRQYWRYSIYSYLHEEIREALPPNMPQ